VPVPIIRRRAEGGPAVAVRVIGEGGVRVVAQADPLHAPLDEADGRLAVMDFFGRKVRSPTPSSSCRSNVSTNERTAATESVPRSVGVDSGKTYTPSVASRISGVTVNRSGFFISRCRGSGWSTQMRMP
jgi:hypothetical protein